VGENMMTATDPLAKSQDVKQLAQIIKVDVRIRVSTKDLIQNLVQPGHLALPQVAVQRFLKRAAAVTIPRTSNKISRRGSIPTLRTKSPDRLGSPGRLEAIKKPAKNKIKNKLNRPNITS
jgi:hypothetical protein